jgi:hypothetical protein
MGMTSQLDGAVETTRRVRHRNLAACIDVGAEALRAG